MLPAIAVCLLVLLLVWPAFREQTRGFRLSAVSIESLTAKELRMTQPRYVGVDGQDRPFRISARTATQRDGLTEEVVFQDITAEMELADGEIITLQSTTGTYFQKGNRISLSQGVALQRSDTYELFTESAMMDLTAQEITSSAVVTGQGPLGQMQAQGLRILLQEGHIFLLGKTTLTFYPDVL